MTKLLGELIARPADVRRFGVAKDIIDSHTYVGVEVELEGVWIEGSTQHCPLIREENDYSLRGDDSKELLFAMPLKGCDIEEALRAIEYMATRDERPTLSSRTSTHVHIDIRDMSVLQLRKFIAVYVSVERMLFHYCGREREENVFCVPLYKSTDTIKSISRLLSAQSMNNFQDILMTRFNDANRYGALNLSSMQKHGTVEFRMRKGEYRYSHLAEWVNILLSIKKYALTAKDKEIFIPSHVYSNNCDKYIRKVFGKFADTLRYEGYEQDVVKGARLSQEVLKDPATADNVWDILELSRESQLLSTKEMD